MRVLAFIAPSLGHTCLNLSLLEDISVSGARVLTIMMTDVSSCSWSCIPHRDWGERTATYMVTLASSTQVH